MTDIFVFGSNLAGRHGKGAALHAYKNHGAKYGQGVGRQGNSYAIPTKNTKLKTLPLNVIGLYVQEFILYASKHPELTFRLTAIGCGFAGYLPNQIAPLFRGVPSNVIIPNEFRKYI